MRVIIPAIKIKNAKQKRHMTTNDLANINEITRKLIRDYITRNGITEAKFAREAGIHQNQLWIYLHSNNVKKGIHTSTLERIGTFLSNE